MHMLATLRVVNVLCCVHSLQFGEKLAAGVEGEVWSGTVKGIPKAIKIIRHPSSLPMMCTISDLELGCALQV